jgi:predicted transcriptional regulator
VAKRITIMIDDDLDRKLRVLQAKAIQKRSTSVSYSSIINEMLRKNLK